jgi:hypothetical protein
MPIRAVGPTKAPPHCVPGAVSPVVKRPRRDVHYSTGAEFKNQWSHNSTYSVYGGSFTFFAFISSVVMKSFVRALMSVCECVCACTHRKV